MVYHRWPGAVQGMYNLALTKVLTKRGWLVYSGSLPCWLEDSVDDQEIVGFRKVRSPDMGAAGKTTWRAWAV